MGEDGFLPHLRLSLSRRNDAAGPAAHGLRFLTTGSGVWVVATAERGSSSGLAVRSSGRFANHERPR